MATLTSHYESGACENKLYRRRRCRSPVLRPAPKLVVTVLSKFAINIKYEYCHMEVVGTHRTVPCRKGGHHVCALGQRLVEEVLVPQRLSAPGGRTKQKRENVSSYSQRKKVAATADSRQRLLYM